MKLTDTQIKVLKVLRATENDANPKTSKGVTAALQKGGYAVSWSNIGNTCSMLDELELVKKIKSGKKVLYKITQQGVRELQKEIGDESKQQQSQDLNQMDEEELEEINKRAQAATKED